jgi:AcrR family transcriptional regulator
MSIPDPAEPPDLADNGSADNDPADTGAAPRRRGRRRDADVDRRILSVARAVYAERGWAGFNFDVIAHQARVSKDAIYRRYTSKIDLLLSTMARAAAEHVPVVPQADTRAYLIAAANRYLEDFVSGHGLNSLRIFVEAPQNPELLEAFHRERAAPVVVQTRAAIRAAIDAGLLPNVTSPTAVLDAILGGVVMHVLATPPELREKMLASARDYVVELVDLVLSGCGYDFGPGDRRPRQPPAR